MIGGTPIPRLIVVLPCYNEEAVLEETARTLSAQLNLLAEQGIIRSDSRMCFVNDGSSDGTWGLIQKTCSKSSCAWGINLAHNRGHQNALLAGLYSVKDYCDCVVTMDADLQHDVGALGNFIEKYRQGCDIVYGVRKKRAFEGIVKKTFSAAYYRMLSHMGVEIVPESADYRLMSRRAIEALMEYRESDLFLRGIIPTIGLVHDTVEYEQKDRFAGSSKYPFRKMVQFAVTGITSLTDRPLTMLFSSSAVITATGLLAAALLAIMRLSGRTVSLSHVLLVSVWLGTGLNLLAVGTVGIYLGKIYTEVKARPRFLIQDFIRDGHVGAAVPSPTESPGR